MYFRLQKQLLTMSQLLDFHSGFMVDQRLVTFLLLITSFVDAGKSRMDVILLYKLI